MCGLAGIYRTDGTPIPDEWLAQLDARIAARGPDGSGVFRDRVEIDGGVREVALLHRRLSILDHDGGSQPMVSQRGRTDDEGLVAVICNGCIYNHAELRRELERAGHVFESDHSDTEVLIHGWREWGADLDDHLEGMYAAAIWDRGRGAVALLRDWFGEKPFFLRSGVGDDDGVMVFGSDAYALASLDAFADGFDQLWVHTYLQLGYDWRGRTPYGSTPERAVIATPLTIAQRHEELMPVRAKENTTTDEFETLIDQAVRRRLDADVPLGCFLSGGVDSSLVAALALRARGELATFTVRMPDERYDESHHAERVAESLGTKHETLDAAARPAEDLEHLVDRLGRPFADSSILPTYWVSRAARQHVTVALSGDGGDELFLGYDRYMKARHIVRHRRLLQLIPTRWLTRAHPKTTRHRVGRAGAMARDLSRAGLLALEHIFHLPMIRDLIRRDPPAPAEFGWGFDPMQDLRRADLQHYLPGDLLTKVDTASMAVALEVRAPFLDRHLTRAALAAPSWQLVPGGQRKGLLREIARRHVPDAVVDRPKQGFAIPIGEWFRDDYGGLGTMLRDHLHAKSPFGPFELDMGTVRALEEEHMNGVRDHGQRLFALLTLSIWGRRVRT